MKQLICNLAYFLIRLKFWEAFIIWKFWKNPSDWEDYIDPNNIENQEGD